MHILQKILANVDLINTNKMEEVVKQLKLNLEKDISELRDFKGVLLESEHIATILEELPICHKIQQEQNNNNLFDTIFVISKDSIYACQINEIKVLLSDISTLSQDILDMRHSIAEFNDDSLLQKMRE